MLSRLCSCSARLGVAGVGWASFCCRDRDGVVGRSRSSLALMADGARPSRARIFDARRLSRACSRVNRDIMIRSFALLFAFAFFTRAGRAAGEWCSPRTRS